MDVLTHVFIPLTIAYVLRPDLFPTPRYLALGMFGLLPDLDKLLGVPGLLHSLVTVVPICLGVIAVGHWYRGDSTYGVLASAFVMSHLLLDVIEGVPVPLLFPIVSTGVGLSYPMSVVFGADVGLLGFTFQGSPVSLEVGEIQTGHAVDPEVDTNTFGFVNGTGIMSALVFLTVYVGLQRTEQDVGAL